MTYPLLSAKYKIIGQLGQGSFGKSYLAEETDANRSVVIKIFENFEIWDCLKQNEALLCSIDNPYIVHIYAAEEIGTNKCLIQENIDGVALNAYISNNDLTLAEFINIAGGILKAIEYLQTLNLSHKDIKPSNIIEALNPLFSRVKRSRCRSSQEVNDAPTPFSALNYCLLI